MEAKTEMDYMSNENMPWSEVDRLVLLTSVGNTKVRDIAHGLERSIRGVRRQMEYLGVRGDRNPHLDRMQNRWEKQYKPLDGTLSSWAAPS